MGASADTPITSIGTIPSDDFAAVVRAWKIRVNTRRDTDPPIEREPTLVETGKALYLGRIARSKLGLENIAVAAAPGPLTAAPTGASSVATRKVKMNQILSQLDETEIDVVTTSEQVRMLARYETLFGKGQRPQPNHEPSIEQLSGLKALVDGGQCPYADFAIFQPYAARIMKRIKFSGLVITKSGALSQAEIYGPPDLDSWRSSYDVWANAMIMLDTMDLGPLQTYKARIENLHSRYGESKVWSLLYQADTRARLEHMPRSKIQLYRLHKEAADAGNTTPYDDNRPWNYTLQTVANDDKYWSHEFVEPALIILADAKGLKTLTSDDAKVATTSSGSRQTGTGADQLTEAPAIKPRNPNRTGRVHDVVEGAYRSNRTGYRLCAEFNQGNCTNMVQGSWCGNDSTQAHQCSRCLGTHPVIRCHHQETPAVGWVKRGQGKGKGKSKRGKGKKGQNPY